MLILSLDTTSEMGGVAIFRDAECLAESPHWGAGNYSVALFTGLDTVLRAAKLDIKEIDVFAAANGPGSFTGIRTGLAAALGWSKACGRAVRGVSILDALVEEGAPSTEFAVPILDARRGEFYGALFRRILPETQGDPGKPLSTKPRLFSAAGEGFVFGPAPLSSLMQSAANGTGNLTCVVREHEIATTELRQSLPPGIEWVTVRGHLLAAVARLARIAQLGGIPPSWQELDAHYIRRTDAETNLKD
ncbi:MAG: tRNA (adenosine(37)-N6)-threonylcarbamoyltransferase complex dimerization subunit type 1 TsaB [Terriglobia bacterium]